VVREEEGMALLCLHLSLKSADEELTWSATPKVRRSELGLLESGHRQKKL
jgi:hypothetical protein